MKKIFLITEDQLNYQGEHEAPSKEEGSSLDNLSNLYPEDIYSNNAPRLYGHYGGNKYDQHAIGIIQRMRGKPKRQVKIYRAVPDINYDINKQIKGLESLIVHRNKYNSFPVGNSTIDKLKDKYGNKTGSEYNQMMDNIYQDLIDQVEKLKKDRKKPLKINNGDWVTITKEYAKEHGISNLNNKYKILSKTVFASQLYSEGDSIHEWAYWV